MADEPENLVLQLLREIRERMDTNTADLRSEMHSLRADVAADMHDLEKKLSEQISGLRKDVMAYHSSALGHGLIISELEERVRRLEDRLGIQGA